MQVFFIFGLLAATQAMAKSTNCWNSGPDDAEYDTLLLDNDKTIRGVCEYLSGNAGHFSEYQEGETRYMCVATPTHKWDFSLKLIHSKGSKPGSNLITTNECLDGMKKQAHCKGGHGGETAYGHWKYRADPNSGRCLGEQ